MRVNFDEVKTGDMVYVLNLNTGEPESVKIVENEFNKQRFIAQLEEANLLTKLHNTKTGPIDDIRYIDYISNFDNTTMSWYMPLIVDAIANKKDVYVIREAYRYGKVDKYVDKANITKVYYQAWSRCWKIKTESIDKYIVTCHKASKSLGLTIFFDRDNAVEKLESLKGGINWNIELNYGNILN